MQIITSSPPHKEFSSDGPTIELVGLGKWYRQGREIIKAVDEVSLHVAPGDFLLITGRSGSGKTTLLSLIGGLTSPCRGRVHLFGKNLGELNDDEISALRAGRVGYVFQFASLIPTLTALDNVRLPGLFAGKPITGRLDHSEQTERAIRLLSWVGLRDMAHRYPAQLSGGQQTRVALARSLVNGPQLILADEPTGNLDVETEEEIMGLLRDFNHREAATIVMVTHNPGLAPFVNRHMIMDMGRLHEAERPVRSGEAQT
jgi:ABC-type lipoprotein export system ATPase subunit